MFLIIDFEAFIKKNQHYKLKEGLRNNFPIKHINQVK